MCVNVTEMEKTNKEKTGSLELMINESKHPSLLHHGMIRPPQTKTELIEKLDYDLVLVS